MRIYNGLCATIAPAGNLRAGEPMAPNDQQRELGAEGRTTEARPSPLHAPAAATEPGAVALDVAAEAQPSDGALIVLLRTQPAAGVAALYDRYGRLVFSMALRIAQDH